MTTHTVILSVPNQTLTHNPLLTLNRKVWLFPQRHHPQNYEQYGNLPFSAHVSMLHKICTSANPNLPIWKLSPANHRQRLAACCGAQGTRRLGETVHRGLHSVSTALSGGLGPTAGCCSMAMWVSNAILLSDQ